MLDVCPAQMSASANVTAAPIFASARDELISFFGFLEVKNIDEATNRFRGVPLLACARQTILRVCPAFRCERTQPQRERVFW